MSAPHATKEPVSTSVTLTPDRAMGVVRPHGELDVSNVEALGRALDRVRDCREVVIDLADVTFMDSAALGMFITAQQDLGGALRIVNAPRGARRVFEVTGVTELLNVETP